MATWTFKRALKEIGLPVTFSVRTKEAFEQAMHRWKELTVAARQASDEYQAATLSLCKNIIKKEHEKHQSRICPACGNAKLPGSFHCQMCHCRIRFYSHDLDNKLPPMHEIESLLTTIPPVERRHGELMEALKKLSKGQIGDSFITNRTTSSVLYMAKTVGGRVICRIANPEEKDLKKRRHRVWRSDGLSMEEVNEVIRKRRAGEKPPPPKEWVPMSSEELNALKGRNHPKPGRPPGKSSGSK